MLPAFLRKSLPFLLIVLVLVGCRSYGGHGSEEKTYEQIEHANQVFADELQRAQSDLRLLTRASDDASALSVFMPRYEALLVTHEALLESHREKEEELSRTSSHRDLSRALGAIVAEQRLMRNQYQTALRQIARVERPEHRLATRYFLQGQYKIAPVYYERIANQADQMTMRRALLMAQDQLPDEIEELEDIDEDEVEGELPAVDTDDNGDS